MAKYDSLPALRRALSSDDPDRRAKAYGDVASVGIDPVDALSDEPPEQELVDAGLIPASEESQQMHTQEYRQQVLALLEQIEANTGGSA